MNLLILEEGELRDEREIVLSGPRARQVLAERELVAGDRLRVGGLDGRIGAAAIQRVSAEEIVASVGPFVDAAPLEPVSIILAIPRPQILKQVLRTCGMFGVERLMLVRSAASEKSYFQSSVLRAENLRRHLLDGLEQGVVTRLPLVSEHRLFRPFVEDQLDQLLQPSTVRLLPDPSGAQHFATLGFENKIRLGTPVVVAIGAESGWSEFELQLFAARGFVSFSLGLQILRVDVALSALLGQIDLLRRMGASTAGQ